MNPQFSSCWTPVQTEQSEGVFTVSVWDRSYRFDHSLFPTEILTAGAPILAEPIALVADFGGHTGEWSKFHYMLMSSTDEQVVIVASAQCENVVADATITVEFDGFVKTELRLMSSWQFSADNRARLTALALKTVLKAEHSPLFHYWPNDKNSILPAADVINAGATVTTEFPFKPYLWAGWNEGGLGLFCGESDQGWEPDDPDRCITVRADRDRTEITLHLLDHTPTDWQEKGQDRWIANLRPICFTLGFHATPVKPMPKQREELVCRMHAIWDDSVTPPVHPDGDFLYQDGYAEECAKSGVKWLILHEEWSAIQNYGRPADEDRFRAFVAHCHELGLKVMVYFGYEYSSLVPEFNRNADRYLIKTVGGDTTGGWQRMPAQRDFMVCYRGGYSDEMLARVRHVMEDYGVDGIYTDGTFVPWECANEAHGCGYRDREGQLHVTYPILAIREHVKKLYTLVHEHGGILDTHQSSCCIMPTLSFCDSYYDGENIQSLLREHPETMTSDSFRAEFFGVNLGIPCNFIAYSGTDYPISFPAGFSLVHNVFPRPSQRSDLPYLSKLWEIFRTYRLDEGAWIPYYSSPAAQVEGTLTSMYDCKDYAVIAVYDTNSNRASARLTSPGYTAATDLINGGTMPLTDGAADLPARPLELQLYLLK